MFDDTRIVTRARSKVYKLGLLLGPFVHNRKYMSLKFTGELRVVTMRNDEKFDFSVQNWHEEFDEF